MDKGRAALAKKVTKKKEEMNNDNSNNNENNNNNNNNNNNGGSGHNDRQIDNRLFSEKYSVSDGALFNLMKSPLLIDSACGEDFFSYLLSYNRFCNHS